MGRRPTCPGGLSAAIYARVPQSTVESVERLRQRLTLERGVTFSTADVVRLVLAERLAAEGEGPAPSGGGGHE